MPDAEFNIEDLIKDEDVAITVTNAGYIKRTPVSTYSRQGRGGKGPTRVPRRKMKISSSIFLSPRPMRI